MKQSPAPGILTHMATNHINVTATITTRQGTVLPPHAVYLGESPAGVEFVVYRKDTESTERFAQRVAKAADRLARVWAQFRSQATSLALDYVRDLDAAGRGCQWFELYRSLSGRMSLTHSTELELSYQEVVAGLVAEGRLVVTDEGRYQLPTLTELEPVPVRVLTRGAMDTLQEVAKSSEGNGGDFTFSDELEVPASVKGTQGLASHLGHLQAKGLVWLESDCKVNGERINATQLGITTLGWKVLGIDRQGEG